VEQFPSLLVVKNGQAHVYDGECIAVHLVITCIPLCRACHLSCNEYMD